MGKLRFHLFQQPLWMCPDVIDATLCVTVIVNTFVVLLNLSIAVPIAVELFVEPRLIPLTFQPKGSNTLS
jgi:hypothetical protein